METVAVEGRRLGRPVDADSKSTRARIVEVALEAFGNEGFEGTTNRCLAHGCGISSAALYHYFPSKADIYVAACETILDVFAGVFARVCAADATLAGRLTLIMEENLELGRTAPSVIGFVAGMPATAQRHPEVLRGVEHLGAGFRRLVREMISGATRRDEVLRGADEAGFAEVVGVVLSGLGRLSARGQHERHAAASRAFLALIGPEDRR